MTDVLSKKLESKLDHKILSRRKRRLPDGFKGDKVVNEVLDRPTVMTLYRMITGHVIAYVNGSVSAGKESVLFWGVGEDGSDVALKVYLVSTSNFKRREPYITGDPRFSRVKRGTRSMVYLWARKEFRNLTQCRDAGIPVPRPIHVSNNVLATEFMGSGGMPARLLLHSEVGGGDYDEAVGIITDMYQKARLVHGDFSEYNIFKTDAGLTVFDLGSAVDLRHPNATGFLRRDIANIGRFFRKKGVDVGDTGEILGGIVR